jgi:hypothetical protein
MKREGIAFLSIALVLLVFATLSTVFIYNMSKDVYRSQQQVVKAKASFYPKIAILSTINIAENNETLILNNADLSYEGTITNHFKVKLDTPSNTGINAFPVPLEDTEIMNNISLRITKAKETIDAISMSVYLVIDSTQTNISNPATLTTSTWYPEVNSVFVDSMNNLTFTSTTTGEFAESVIYKLK